MAEYKYLDKAHLSYYTSKLMDKLAGIFVPQTRKVNNKTLNSDITLGASDVLTSGQQDAVNSGVTSSDVTKLSGIEAGAEVNVQANWNESDTTSDAYIQNKPTIPAAQVQSDWTEADTSAVSYIQNKPALATVATSGSYNDLLNQPTIPPSMTILSYGNSTWADFIACYTTNTVVYCRASSNANPATGAQNRLAFMAYLNDATNPTNVEFQYYRSVATHTDAQQGDQVFVYKLDKTAGWSVTTRNAFSKVNVSTGLSKSYSSGTITLSCTVTPPTVVQTTGNSQADVMSQDAVTKVVVGTTETAAIATSDWVALSSSDPYDYQTTITATATIDASTGVVELINDQAVLFGTYGFAIGAVSGQSVTIYSIGQPAASVTLTLNIRNL